MFWCMAEGVGFGTYGWFNPTLDFESSALNRTQPPFLLITNHLRRPNLSRFEFYTVIFYGQHLKRTVFAARSPEEEKAGTPTQVQFLYRHQNGWYYVPTFASGKEKWKSRGTNPHSNRGKPHGASLGSSTRPAPLPPRSPAASPSGRR